MTRRLSFAFFFAFVELCPAGQGEISREVQESPEIAGVFEVVNIVHIGIEFYGDSVAAKKSGNPALDIFFCGETPGKVSGQPVAAGSHPISFRFFSGNTLHIGQVFHDAPWAVDV